MTHYLRWPIGQLPFHVGANDDRGMRIARDVEGYISFGPYCRLEPGIYFAGFHIRSLEESDAPDLLKINACHRAGNDFLGTRSVSGQELYCSVAGLVGVEFTVENETSDLEVQLIVYPPAAIEVRSLVIFRNEPV